MFVEKEDKFGIVQFHGDNFSTWKCRVEAILQEYGVFECLTEILQLMKQPEMILISKTTKPNLSLSVCSRLSFGICERGTIASEKWFKLVSTFKRVERVK
ncbi:hypothetical protein JTB14_031372 [Gonioctena quinquepunctata]|nr:hypothetical protein JTB14_031372 [Gonioctena quinquepunctata]